jgi:ABC-type transport system substrate-binding protein
MTGGWLTGRRDTPSCYGPRVLGSICRRVAVAIPGVAALGLGLFTACGDDAEPEIPAEVAPVALPEPTLADRTLVIAVRSLPRGLDPLGDADAWGERVIDDLLFEGLVRRDSAAAPWVVHGLADECRTDDPKATRRIVCHLRSDARFSDGAAVTMDDVVYSLRYWLDPRRSAARARHSLHNMRSVEVVDGPLGASRGQRDPGRWVRVEFEGRDPLALERLAAVKIVPRALHRGRAEKFAREPVGSGPMRLVHRGEDRLVFERIDGWERGERGPAGVERLVLHAMNDGAASLTALRRDDVQIIGSLADIHVPEELGRPGMAARFVAWVASPPRFDTLLFNARPDSDVPGNLRRALVSAIPRAGIERERYARPGHPRLAPVDPGPPRPIDLWQIQDVESLADVPGLPVGGSSADDVVGHAAAADLLERLGYRRERGLLQRGEHTLRVTLTWDGSRGHAEAVAAGIRASWRQLGLQTPEAIASWAYLMGLMRRGEFDTALARIATHEDADLYPWFHTRGRQNLSGLADAELDRALVAYRLAETAADRAAAQQRVYERLAALQVAWVIHAPAPVIVASKRIRGWEFVDDLPRLDTLTLSPPGSANDWRR